MDYRYIPSNTDRQIKELQAARLQSWGRINKYRLRAILKYSGSSILDVGCSTGSYVRYLNNKGYKALGLDLLSDSDWKINKEKFYVVGSALQIPFTNRAFDTVLSFELLEHVYQPEQALKEMYRICRNNIILSVPDCELSPDMLNAGVILAHWRDRTHYNYFTIELIKNLLERNGFQLELLTRINPIRSDYLVYKSFHMPDKLAILLSRLTKRIPLRKQFFMTILAVANKVN